MEDIKSIFDGKTMVATGRMKNYTRREINKKFISLGAKVGYTVSYNTDYVVAGAKAGRKLINAKRFGIKILTEEEFEAMVG